MIPALAVILLLAITVQGHTLTDQGDRTNRRLEEGKSEMDTEDKSGRELKGDIMLPRDPSEPGHKSSRAATVDWRESGCVTPVQDQGRCNSGWAFAAADSVAYFNCVNTSKLVQLSAQQLIDCSFERGNEGCNGGEVVDAYEYIIANGGLESQKEYPYVGQVGSCESIPSNNTVYIRKYNTILSGSESQLEAAVDDQPVAVTVDASLDSFKNYTTGVYNDPACSSTKLNHAMLVVGYGSEEGQSYWIVKNSWGSSWGEEGYIRMAKDKNNNCGIATRASYPVV